MSKDIDRKTFEVYYPNYYFFEGYKFHLVSLSRPNIGVSFSSYNESKEKGFHLSFDWYEFIGNYWAKKHLTSPGLITGRKVLSFSAGMNKPLINSNKFQISGLAEINFRTGYENWWSGLSLSGTELLFAKRQMFDLGASIGSKLTYKLPFNLTLSLEAKQGLYYFRWYNFLEIFEDTPSWDKGTPLAALNINVKLGFQFD